MPLLMLVAGIALGENPQVMENAETWSHVLIIVAIITAVLSTLGAVFGD